MEARENTQVNTSTASLLRPVLVSAVLFMLVCGLVYPLLTTGVAQVIFPYQANGSLIERNGEVVGSELIAQQFTEPQYFQPRPSETLATGSTEEPQPYNAAQSGASNWGATNQELISAVEERVGAYRADNNLPDDAPVPVDAVTASGSGLDPHISLANAEVQIPRVAEARGISEDEVRQLVENRDITEARLVGFIGDPGVNVLRLNLALDGLEGGLER